MSDHPPESGDSDDEEVAKDSKIKGGHSEWSLSAAAFFA